MSENEVVGAHSALRKVFEYRRYGCGVLRRVELAILLDRFLDALVIVHPERFDPGHGLVSPFEGLRLISKLQHFALERRRVEIYPEGSWSAKLEGPRHARESPGARFWLLRAPGGTGPLWLA